MKIAAGVLIIVVAAMDLGSGIGYVFMGAAAEAVGEAGEQIVDFVDTETPGGPGAQEARDAAGEVKATGGMWGLFGFLCFVVGGLGIAAGVLLFQEKAAVLVMAVGGAQVLVDLISMVGWRDVGVTNLFAIAVGAFVVYVGSTYRMAGPQPEPPDVAPA
jgi:hypothetical protein